MTEGTEALCRLAGDTARRERAGLRRRLRPRSPDGDGLIDLASNDYLGLATDERLVEAAVQATRTWGAGATGSRLVTGSTGLHRELERELAAFLGVPAALTFSSGYLANLGAVTALAGRGSLVLSDAHNHASIVDACRLSRSRVEVTEHADPAAVERRLAAREEENAVVVTDAVFSVAGDRAPLEELHRACRRRGALLVVDEAHSLGVLGPGGRGLTSADGLVGEPDVVITLTLSKSLGTQGGAVLAEPEVIDTLVDTGRAFVFDTGLAPGCAGAAVEGCRVLAAEPELAETVRARAGELAALARAHNLVASDPAAAVVRVPLGDPIAAVAAANRCAEAGLRVGCFRPPSVPEGASCLRLTARATLTDNDMKTVEAGLTAVQETVSAGHD